MAECSIDDCTMGVHARGWCNTHYGRWRRNGDPLKVQYIHGDDLARILSYVDASGDCWEWTGAVSQYGYGLTRHGGYSTRMAHRALWSELVGPIPKDMTIDHLCRNKLCVNPDHLEVVTMQVNQLRGYSPAGKNARKTHCKRGHPLSGDNIYRYGTQRICKQCLLLRGRQYYWRDKERA